MTVESRITDLEIRLTHQEAALDELSRASLRQQQTIDEMLAKLEHVNALIQQLAPAAAGPASEEPPPPHY
jgi:SlyX protein